MAENSESPERGTTDAKTTTREEARTIGFRLREIQRLLNIRVVQENRRLEADGLEPVTEGNFSTESETQSEDSGT